MRLTLATPLYPPEPGGPATYAKLLEERLPAAGIEVEVVKFGDFRKHPKIVRHICFFFAVLRSAKKSDAILALDPVSVGLPAAFAAKISRKPFYAKVVGDYAWEQGTQRFGIQENLDDFDAKRQVSSAVRTLHAVQAWVASSAKQVIVPSEYLKGIVGRWGIPAERIQVIHNAMKREEPSALPDTAASLSRPRVVTLARLVPWKGIDRLIDACATVRKSIPGTQLIIVGDGPERDRLARHAEATIPDGYMLTGALPHREALALLRDADCFVLNTSYEGLSHVLIEAMAEGTPIVTTPVGGNPELITDGIEGLLVAPDATEPLAEALIRILADSELAATLGGNARAKAGSFTEDAMIEKTVAFFLRA
ncbi:MAG TPA: glycosyltransferase family 4 protein [Candidatus Paceibacterota bacterium]|nr:glycosyltransferase family 4 protein [Candidatus Paceibacterota bacterium]